MCDNRTRVLTTHMSNASALNLNSVLLESPATLTDNYAQETQAVIRHGIRNKSVSIVLHRKPPSLIQFQTFISDNCVLAAGKYLLVEKKSPTPESLERIIETLATVLTPESPIDTKRLALVVIRTVSRTHNDLITATLSTLAPVIFTSVRSPVIPVKLAAEAAFLSLFSVVDRESEVFDAYMASAGAGSMNATTKRSMQDYFKRVAMRLGAQARERREAEGGQGGLGLSNDEREDEREIWSVGKVDLGEGAFGDE